MGVPDHPIDAIRLDPNMSLKEQSSDRLRWLSPLQQPFEVTGFAWFGEERRYRRLPGDSRLPLREAVDLLADCTAGGQIHFRTDSTRLSIRTRLAGPANMYHMPATGQNGFDCYTGEFGSRTFISVASFDPSQREYESILYEGLDRRMRSVAIHFPLYQGVEEVWIGLDPDAEAIVPSAYRLNKRIICYGTSITQGGCASRPGMAYPNILSRRLPYEFINLGFSGNGKGESELARLIAEIDNPGLLVLDYEANVSIAEYKAALPEFIRIYRERHARVPVLVVSKIRYGFEGEKPEHFRERMELRAFASETVRLLRAQGDDRIYFQDGEELLGEREADYTVDGVHPTDLGFQTIADRLQPALNRILDESIAP
ncbi:hypothetical protein B1A99_23850 [Cohnella sp. CIP 111063]|uniref:SGNH/GDSL hydrolase family protein n=1 Tax=unclassified Cohnella TaxID=2636738 RepID=UPI000B8BF294|nr:MULTISPECIES: SGNH/GDSL hydrolase family protein [unclassified Cohnella]OXS55307.1 hypothetical protein B1A99_23850 [Cohnella sp. CIP 111063]PRX65739.1 lysophospholipase L1-like esterase [Cohnella sp. SGD-V74]